MLSPLSLAGLGSAISANRRRDEIWADETLERGRVINVGGGLFLDRLKDMAFTASNDGMELLVDFARLRMQTAL